MKQTALEFPEPFVDKYRPRKIEDFIGLPRVKAVIHSFLQRPRSESFLFTGPSGRGKSVMGLVMAEILEAELQKIPSRQADLEGIQRISNICAYKPFNFTTGKSTNFHFILIEECDKITPAAQIALLSKTDSVDRPLQTIFVLTSNEDLRALEPRLRSRMKILIFDNEGLVEELPAFLAKIAVKEGFKRKLDFARIARDCEYNVRDALNRLETEIMGASYLTEGYDAGNLRASIRLAKKRDAA